MGTSPRRCGTPCAGATTGVVPIAKPSNGDRDSASVHLTRAEA